MSEAEPAPERYQMSARNQRRWKIGIGLAVLALFVAGSVAFFVSFRHHTICPGGAQWISRTDDGIGEVTYVCPNGKIVKEGLVP